MFNRVNWKKAFIQAAAVGLIFCLGLALVVGGFVLVNYDHLGRFMRVVYLIDTQYLNGTSRAGLVDGAIDGMVGSLDPYSSFQDAEENKVLMNSIQGTFGGIGVHLSTADPEKLVVMRPIKGSPAERAGLEAGDIITKIDETDVSTISQDEAVAILRGEPGSKVTVKIYRPKTKTEFTVSLIRDYINVPTVEGISLPGRSDIGLIDISSFNINTGDELEKVLREMDLTKYKGLIIDLRYNYGGEVNAAIKVASFLVPEGSIVHIVNRNGVVDTKESTAEYIDMPIVILTNEYTASAAEIVSGAVKDYGSGALVGTKTYGKGVVQTVFTLDGNTSVKLTTDKYLTPKKNDINKLGIKPDVEVELKEGEKPTILPTEPVFDSQLSKAVEVLLQKIQ
ncbi:MULTISPECIES: S41 family peptidase [Dehalobacter]|uniref:Carboxyl-terminal protease n=1 Tax=Dehalobacter restrictus (strain DSM 9455 / PER-K23) TaxID=871738 RepID=A0ABM5P8K1_DEHRP|nr:MULTISPECIES: S41 family peptidase [unclassified Dehalobacter]AHF11058.1 carboxyl-terminal protease [Dehalobacter restrictus DSM 9455]MDJ0305201.1 S41 family peptidase [Dehalobacter sp.]OCZ53920.1 peptidase S41 [Dehalobacter sp. TeCB1]